MYRTDPPIYKEMLSRIGDIVDEIFDGEWQDSVRGVKENFGKIPHRLSEIRRLSGMAIRAFEEESDAERRDASGSADVRVDERREGCSPYWENELGKGVD